MEQYKKSQDGQAIEKTTRYLLEDIKKGLADATKDFQAFEKIINYYTLQLTKIQNEIDSRQATLAEKQAVVAEWTELLQAADAEGLVEKPIEEPIEEVKV